MGLRVRRDEFLEAWLGVGLVVDRQWSHVVQIWCPFLHGVKVHRRVVENRRNGNYIITHTHTMLFPTMNASSIFRVHG